MLNVQMADWLQTVNIVHLMADVNMISLNAVEREEQQ